MRVNCNYGKVDILKEEKQKKIFNWSQVCPSKPVGEEKSEPRGGREGRRRKRSKKNQVCLCLRIKCIRFLGLGYGD